MPPAALTQSICFNPILLSTRRDVLVIQDLFWYQKTKAHTQLTQEWGGEGENQHFPLANMKTSASFVLCWNRSQIGLVYMTFLEEACSCSMSCQI